MIDLERIMQTIAAKHAALRAVLAAHDILPDADPDDPETRYAVPFTQIAVEAEQCACAGGCDDPDWLVALRAESTFADGVTVLVTRHYEPGDDYPYALADFTAALHKGRIFARLDEIDTLAPGPEGSNGPL